MLFLRNILLIKVAKFLRFLRTKYKYKKCWILKFEFSR